MKRFKYATIQEAGPGGLWVVYFCNENKYPREEFHTVKMHVHSREEAVRLAKGQGRKDCPISEIKRMGKHKSRRRYWIRREKAMDDTV